MKPWIPICRVALLLLLGKTGACYALGSGRGPQSDFFVDVQYAFTTSKSKLVGSNDTGTALRYGLGGFAGSNSNLSFLLHFDQDVTNFQLNSSKIDMNWQDTRVRYHLSYFYLGALFTRLEMTADKEGTEIVDAAGSGMGINAGALIGVGRGGSVYIDVMTATLPNMKNAIDQEISIKQRMDIDLGGSIDLTAKLLDMTFGYKIRNVTVQTDSTYQEALYTTYAGIRMSFQF
ncbi:MAG TPA: hypothetical protein VE954_37020 [Oligoflexus sp.]|uniref:hypothetical protein n=1 Tax=Oligoflexus sp. TaxID=1971216 RepID=UPI002D6AAA35|nr:hypothetical protein [Oligoflexus sp.]HYX38741.1 hypothetical protein [Oligoflexus sp.]